MSGSHFHVHGPHDHVLEHAAHPSAASHATHAQPSTGLTGRLAMITAVLASVGACFSYMAGSTQAHAGLYKNHAALIKTEAANRWNHFQAKSNRQNLAEMAAELSPSEDVRQRYRREIERYRTEKREIQSEAERLEQESANWDARSEQQLHRHHRWAQAMTTLQVSIALAAIALLSARRWMTVATLGAGVVGLALGVAAWWGV